MANDRTFEEGVAEVNFTILDILLVFIKAVKNFLDFQVDFVDVLDPGVNFVDWIIPQVGVLL